MRKRIPLLISSLMINCVFGESALACSVCFGNKDSELTKGISWGIFVLLGIVLTVLILFGTFIFTFNKRSKIAGKPVF